MQKTVSIVVKGKVQGVFFRKYTKEKALELGLTGTVRNEKDGSVFIIASGTDQQLQQFVSWCKQGPPRAKVDTVHTEEIRPLNFNNFNIEKR
jgi:acylphosphatase